MIRLRMNVRMLFNVRAAIHLRVNLKEAPDDQNVQELGLLVDFSEQGYLPAVRCYL